MQIYLIMYQTLMADYYVIQVMSYSFSNAEKFFLNTYDKSYTITQISTGC